MITGIGGHVFDMLIIGAGPAGLSAVVNAKARNIDALILDARSPVAKVRTYPEITNYLGFPKATGAELATRFAEHLAKTGCEFRKERTLKIMPGDGTLTTSTDKGIYTSRSVVLAVGVAQKSLLPGEEDYLGRGVSYCVTCDGALFRGKDVVVVGYIPEGEEEANTLAGFARSVTYVAMYKNVTALDPAIRLVHETPVRVEGGSRARMLVTESSELPADGIFILREAIPITTILPELPIEDRFIEVDREMYTGIAGVFAAGDCTGPPFQIAKAVGEGQVAALAAARYVHGITRKENSKSGDVIRSG